MVVNDFDAKKSARYSWVLVVTELVLSGTQCIVCHSCRKNRFTVLLVGSSPWSLSSQINSTPQDANLLRDIDARFSFSVAKFSKIKPMKSRKTGLLNPPVFLIFAESSLRTEARVVVLVTSTVRGRVVASRLRGTLTPGRGRPAPPVPETPGGQASPARRIQGEHAGVPARPGSRGTPRSTASAPAASLVSVFKHCFYLRLRQRLCQNPYVPSKHYVLYIPSVCCVSI